MPLLQRVLQNVCICQQTDNEMPLHCPCGGSVLPSDASVRAAFSQGGSKVPVPKKITVNSNTFVTFNGNDSLECTFRITESIQCNFGDDLF